MVSIPHLISSRRLRARMVVMAAGLALAAGGGLNAANAAPAASTGAPTAVTSAPAERALPPEHERALFASTYASLRDRVDERGYAPTSLSGYYAAMYTRDASVNALALVLGKDYTQARAILRYILRYTVASGQPTIPHRIYSLADTLETTGQQTYTSDAVVALGGPSSYTQAMPAPGLVTAVDTYLSRTKDAGGTVTATLRAGTGPEAPVVDTTSLPVSDIPTAGGWVTFRFLPPLFSTPPAGGYSLTLEVTGGPPGKVTWYGNRNDAAASFRERTDDFTFVDRAYDTWNQVDEKYSVLLVWARYVAANPGDHAFIDETWPLVREYADYSLTRPGSVSEALDLIRNPALDDEGYNDVYDLLTNTVTAEALHELAALAPRLGDPAAAERWSAAADRISGGITKNLVTQVDGRPVYGAWYDGKDPSKFTTGWTFVNLAPVAFSWYGLDPTIMQNTLESYMKYESRDWSGVQMLSSMSDYGFTGANDWVLTKALAWEWAWAAHTGDTARIGQLDQFLRTYYPDYTQPISEGWVLDADGKLRVTDPGNQEHASWYAVMMLQTYPGLQGHPGRCATPRDADPASLITLEMTTPQKVVTAGAPATVEAKLTNNSCDPISNVVISLDLPDGWTTDQPDAEAGDLAARSSTTATFTIQTPNSDTDPITNVTMTGRADYHATGRLPDTTTADFALSVANPVQPPYQTYKSTEAYFGQAGDRFAIHSGGVDMSGSRDEYGTIYLDGAAGPNTMATTKVLSQGNTGEWAKAGIVMRNDLTGRSPGYVIVAVTPGHGFILQWDADGNGYLDGGGSTIATGTSTYPAWLRLQRDGGLYTARYSTDGDTWHTIGSVTVPKGAQTQDVGLFASAVNAVKPGTISAVEYDHFTVQSTGGVLRLPAPTPAEQ